MHIIFICVEAVLIGAPYAFPSLSPTIGQIMFWAGVVGLVAYPAYQAFKARHMLQGWLWGKFGWRFQKPWEQKAEAEEPEARRDPAAPDEDYYSETPEADATDKRAYNDIMAFAIDRVLPACDALIELEEAFIGRMARGPKLGELALAGMRSESRPKTGEFWTHYIGLSSGLAESPGPILKFEGIIEHIHGLEKGSYDFLSQEMFDLCCELERDDFAAIGKHITKWREKHKELVSSYDAIKRDARFGKLLRPIRDSRWGSLKLGEPTQ